MNTKPIFTAFFLSALISVSACASDAGSGEALEDLRSRSETSTYERPYDSVGELIDLIVARHEDGPELGTVVRGTISAVEPGAGFRWDLSENGDNEVRVQLPYGDAEAMINTVHATIKVEEFLAPHSDLRDTEFQFGLAFSPRVPLEAAVADLTNLGEVVVFMDSSPVFDYQPGLHGVMENGQLIGIVNNGNVEFPIADGDELDLGSVTVEMLKAHSHN